MQNKIPISYEQSSLSEGLKTIQVNVGTTPVQLPFFKCRSILIKSDSSNTGNIYAGRENNVSTTTGMQIIPNGAFAFNTNSTSKIWLVADKAGQKAEVAISSEPYISMASNNTVISGSVSTTVPTGAYKWAKVASVAVTITATLVTYTAVAGDKLIGFQGTGTRSGYFFVQVNGATVISCRAWVTNQNAISMPLIAKALTAGDTVTLQVTNESPTNDTGDFEGTLFIG